MAPAALSSLARRYGPFRIDGPNAKRRASSCIDAPAECCASHMRSDEETYARYDTWRWSIALCITERGEKSMRTHVTEQIIDHIIGSASLRCAGFAQAWSDLSDAVSSQARSVHRQTLTPACIVTPGCLAHLLDRVDAYRHAHGETYSSPAPALVCRAHGWCHGLRPATTTWLSDSASIIISMVLGASHEVARAAPWPGLSSVLPWVEDY